MRTNATPNGYSAYASSHRQKRVWLAAVICLAILVVFGTIAALMMPASAMTAQGEATPETAQAAAVETETTVPAETTADAIAEQATAETAALPQAAQVPEGYTVQRTVRDEENGFAVTVYAPEGVIQEDAVLCASLLGQEDEKYQKASEELAEQTDLMPVDTANGAAVKSQDAESDTETPAVGFAALDIHFEDADGNEVEPNGEVFVSIDAAGLIPEDADPESVTVQHHEELDDEAVVVETVADTADETEGVVEVTPAEETAPQTLAETPATDVQAAFAVDNFSTFTIVWENRYSTISVHYGYWENGTIKELNSDNKWVDFSSEDTIETFKAPAVDGYTYKGEAYVVTKYSTTKISDIQYKTYVGWQYKGVENDRWNTYDSRGQTIYFIYEKNNVDPGETVETVDTVSRGVTISLYDYPESINGTISNSSSQFAFSGGGTGFNSNVNENRWFNHWTQDKGGVSQGIVKNTLSESGYPQLSQSITSRDGSGTLEYLFDGSNQYNIQSYENLNYLFQYDEETGYYTYDSAQNFATIYDSDGNRARKNNEDSFIVYANPNSGTSSGSSGHPYFLPFDQPGTSEGQANYHFGMKMTISDFLMPKNGKINNEDMTFSFAGDDDVWVYIDGVLVLDMGGIHNSNTGEINFGTGKATVDKVYYDGSSATQGNQKEEVYIGDLLYNAKAADREWIGKNLELRNDGHWYLKDYSTHDLTFFYLERGAVDSNCKIEFNLYTLQAHSINIAKDLTTQEDSTEDIDNYLANIEYKFRVLQPSGEEVDTQSDPLFIKEGTSYEIRSNDGNQVVGTGIVGKNGIFTVKAGQHAVFSNISEDAGKYYVQELMDEDYSAQFGDVTVSVEPDGGHGFEEDNGLVVDENKFDGAISGKMDASSGVGSVYFTNKVDTQKLSTLSIEKQVLPGSDFNADQAFTIYVTMGGELVPVGTTYQLYGENDKAESKAVETEGEITLKAGERAIFTVLTGTEFVIYEDRGATYHANFTATQQFGNGSKFQYTLTENQLEQKEDGISVSGTVGDLEHTNFEGATPPDDGTNASMAVTLTNSSFDFGTSFELRKTLEGWTDGEDFTFDFNIVETNQNGAQEVTPTSGITMVAPEIAIAESSINTGKGYINFKDSVEVGTYYFKVSEVCPENPNSVAYDTNYYVLTVSVNEASGVKDATITTVEKYVNGQKDNNFNWSGTSSLDFVNSLGTDVTVKKVDASNQNQPLAGAGFKLYYVESGNKYYYAENSGKVTWGDEDSATIMESATSDGLLTFKDLRTDRKYYLVEVSAPAGYKMLEHEVELQWVEGVLKAQYEGGSDNLVNTSGQIVVANSTGVELPETGGAGTTAMTIGGLLLLAAAAGGYELRRRRGRGAE